MIWGKGTVWKELLKLDREDKENQMLWFVEPLKLFAYMKVKKDQMEKMERVENSL